MNELTKRLDNLASVLIESTQYSQYCQLVYEASAKLEAAERLRVEVSRIASITPHQQTKEVLEFALAAFDKETA